MNATSRQKMLIKAGGIAALLAGILFRRNIGAEIDLFSANDIPVGAAEWFLLLQDKPLLGLSFLAIFDLFNSLLVGLMFAGLAMVLWQKYTKAVTAALAVYLAGMIFGFAANKALPMFSLSRQYAAASSAQQAALEAAGEALLARGGASGAYQGSLMTLSLFLIASAGLVFAILMLYSVNFNKAAAIFGLLASGLDLLYCATVLFVPTLAVAFIAAAGLCYMVWHILTGLRLLRL
jgi:hypothetical protein